jgi:hypothetical protein
VRLFSFLSSEKRCIYMTFRKPNASPWQLEEHLGNIWLSAGNVKERVRLAGCSDHCSQGEETAQGQRHMEGLLGCSEMLNVSREPDVGCAQVRDHTLLF